MLLIALLSCTSSTIDDVPNGSDGHEQGYPGDSAEVVGGDTSTDDSGGSEDTGTKDKTACSDLYDPSVVPEFFVDISDADWADLERDYATGQKNYHPVTFTFENEVVPDAMIRLKGNPGFSWFDEKMQFVIAFNEVNPDGRFHGQRKIALDASWYEPTMLRDRISWAVMQRAGGLPTACSNSAKLTINDVYYGLYTNIEFFDHEWLERNFGDENATGTLWKYGYDPVTNAEASDGSAIDEFWSTSSPAALETLGDPGQWEREWAAEAVLGDDDGYWCCNHNFYLYEHPTRGIEFIPWDFDDNFDVQPYDADPVTGYYSGLFQQYQFVALTSDTNWRKRYVDQLEELNDAMAPDVVIADMDAWLSPLEEPLLNDPHRSIGWEEHGASVARMRAWIPQRHEYLKSWISCERGGTDDADGDGTPVCHDPNDNDATVHPGATEVCNGVDDDADGWIDDIAACDDCVRHDFGARHFLFCRWPRKYLDAQNNCQDRGGELTNASGTGEMYMFFFYTWPIREAWWTSGWTGGGQCPGWDEANFTSTTAGCGEPHPSICAVP